MIDPSTVQAKEVVVADNKLIRKTHTDRNHINMDEDWERRYWAKSLGVSEEELEEALRAVGVQIDAVRKYFATRVPKREGVE